MRREGPHAARIRVTVTSFSAGLMVHVLYTRRPPALPAHGRMCIHVRVCALLPNARAPRRATPIFPTLANQRSPPRHHPSQTHWPRCPRRHRKLRPSRPRGDRAARREFHPNCACGRHRRHGNVALRGAGRASGRRRRKSRLWPALAAANSPAPVRSREILTAPGRTTLPQTPLTSFHNLSHSRLRLGLLLRLRLRRRRRQHCILRQQAPPSRVLSASLSVAAGGPAPSSSHRRRRGPSPRRRPGPSPALRRGRGRQWPRRRRCHKGRGRRSRPVRVIVFE